MKKLIFENHLHQTDYWKCKFCNQIVEVQFDACWNCQAGKPFEIITPTYDEILKYQSGEKIDVEINNDPKCNICGHTLQSGSSTCLNCEQNIVGTFGKPAIAEMIKHYPGGNTFRFFRNGYSIVLAGILIILLSGLIPFTEMFGIKRLHYGRVVFGVFFIIVGIIIQVLHYLDKRD